MDLTGILNNPLLSPLIKKLKENITSGDNAGYYLTIVDGEFKAIPVPKDYETFELKMLKNNKI